MTRLNGLTTRTPTAGRQRARGDAHRPAREARARRSFDGVVATYIRELSAADDATPRVRAERELPGS